MEETGKTKKIIWSVDAFEEKSGPQRHVAEIIRRLQRKWHAVVQPVHVLSPMELNLSAEFVGPWVGQYVPSAEQALDRLLSEFALKQIEKPEILTQTSASTTRAADALIEYAERRGADLILVGSHGRTGVSRLLLGSFAETLLLRSTVPVLIVGPHLREDADFGELLAPTDFSEHAKEAFKDEVALARELDARITLYHAILRPIAPVYQSGVYVLGTPWAPVQEYYNRELVRLERRLEGWTEWAGHQGVIADSVIDIESTDVADSILKLARKRNAGWIAMTAQSGPIASAILGSVVRRVVRGAECPVIVRRFAKKQVQQEPKSA